MSWYAWTQDVPIDADAYAAIIARMGDALMPGLVVHLAMERADGSIHYLDVWESKAAHDDMVRKVVHPAVEPVLAERAVPTAGEPPKPPSTSSTSALATESLAVAADHNGIPDVSTERSGRARPGIERGSSLGCMQATTAFRPRSRRCIAAVNEPGLP